MKEEFDEAVYDEQVGMMEMVLDVDDIVSEMEAIRRILQNICKKTGSDPGKPERVRPLFLFFYLWGNRNELRKGGKLQ